MSWLGGTVGSPSGCQRPLHNQRFDALLAFRWRCLVNLKLCRHSGSVYHPAAAQDQMLGNFRPVDAYNLPRLGRLSCTGE